MISGKQFKKESKLIQGMPAHGRAIAEQLVASIREVEKAKKADVFGKLFLVLVDRRDECIHFNYKLAQEQLILLRGTTTRTSEAFKDITANIQILIDANKLMAQVIHDVNNATNNVTPEKVTDFANKVINLKKQIVKADEIYNRDCKNHFLVKNGAQINTALKVALVIACIAAISILPFVAPAAFIAIPALIVCAAVKFDINFEARVIAHKKSIDAHNYLRFKFFANWQAEVITQYQGADRFMKRNA